uniref:ATP synthase CF0 B' chain subunit II n=1 Tax=Nitzschia sp. NIES-3576 TaxID=2083273 RepID=A0A2Z5ZB93_9STRA|nr:ATP synthase CF0 B' chain subunit II [Nitzschia sp. NIES-3576]
MLVISNIKGPDGLFDLNATLPILGIHLFFLTIFLHFFFYNPLQKKKEQRNLYIIKNYNNVINIILFLSQMLLKLEIFLNSIYNIEIIIDLYLEYIHKKFLNFELKISYLSILKYCKLYLSKKKFLEKIYKITLVLFVNIHGKKIINKIRNNNISNQTYLNL